MDTMGWDVDGDDLDIIGAANPRAIKLRNAAAMRGRGIVRPDWAVTLSEQGVSRPSEDMDPLPFVVTQIVTGGPTDSFAEAFPQRPFRGERLIASAFLTTAAGTIDAGGLVLITPAIFVGATQVGASQGETALSVYAATAFGVRLSFPPAGQGTRLYIPFSYRGPALGANDTLLVAMTVVGRAVR